MATTLDLKNILAEHRLKCTKQTLAVAEFILLTHSHPTVSEAYEAVRNKLPSTFSKTTTYKVLRMFVQRGLIKEVFIEPGRTRYDVNLEDHHHFVDIKTGNISDIDAKKLKNLKRHGYRLRNYSMTFFGQIKQRKALKEYLKRTKGSCSGSISIDKILSSYGIRPTSQRVVIAQYLLGVNIHPTADQVIQGVSNKLRPRLSKAGIYETLVVFRDAGLLKEVFIDGNRIRYDTNVKDHHHFIDLATGAVLDIEPEEVVGFDLKLPGYKVQNSQGIFFGELVAKKLSTVV